MTGRAGGLDKPPLSRIYPCSAPLPAEPAGAKTPAVLEKSVLPDLELGTQARDRLRMQLAHARFGHAEHRADFLQVHVLFVVHAHHAALALGQVVDRRNQALTK